MAHDRAGARGHRPERGPKLYGRHFPRNDQEFAGSRMQMPDAEIDMRPSEVLEVRDTKVNEAEPAVERLITCKMSNLTTSCGPRMARSERRSRVHEERLHCEDKVKAYIQPATRKGR